MGNFGCETLLYDTIRVAGLIFNPPAGQAQPRWLAKCDRLLLECVR